MPVNNLRLTISVNPPSSMGTTQGGHLYLEAPDQSSGPAAKMDGSTLMDGSATMQGPWAPIDLGKFPYVSGEQPWILELFTSLDTSVSNDVRLYVSSYSDQIDIPLARYGTAGATPSYVVAVPAVAQNKPSSGSNITPFLVTGITGAVSAPVSVGGKLRRPIGITVNLSGLSATRPTDWAYQLVGYINGDLTTQPVLMSGQFTQDGLCAAGPDGISIPHTFGPEEPTVITSITVYAVAGVVAGSRLPGAPRGALSLATAFTPNNIVPGITASCVVTIGTVTGVVDPTAAIQSLLSSVFGNVSGVFDITALAIDTTRLANLAATSAKLANSSVTATQIANLAVGTGAVQLLAVTTALIANLAVGSGQIANLAVGTGQIANLAVTDAKINDLSVTKLTAGTIAVAVSLTSPTITVTGSTYTINLDATNGFKMTSGTVTLQISGIYGGEWLRITNGTDTTYFSTAGLSSNTTSSAAYANLGYAGLDMETSGYAQTTLGGGGFSRYNSATPFTGTLAAAIAAGKSVVGGVIV